MVSKAKVTAKDSTTTQKGVSSLATSQESIAGQLDNKTITPKTLSDALANSLSNLKFTGLKYQKFVDDIQLQPNYMYICTEPGVKPPADAKLPARGIGKQGDIIIVYNLTTYENVSFKVTLNTDLILHHNGQAISDTDGKYLLGDKGGSCVLLGCGGNQQWFSLLHYQITLTSGQFMNSKIKEEDLKEPLERLDKRYIQSDTYWKYRDKLEKQIIKFHPLFWKAK